MTRMHNPPHPGATLRLDVLPALGLSVTDAASQLGVTRAALARVLNERAAISPAMALRREGAGSRVALLLQSGVMHAHRPHPGKEAKQYQIREIKDWLTATGVKA